MEWIYKPLTSMVLNHIDMYKFFNICKEFRSWLIKRDIFMHFNIFLNFGILNEFWHKDHTNLLDS